MCSVDSLTSSCLSVLNLLFIKSVLSLGFLLLFDQYTTQDLLLAIFVLQDALSVWTNLGKHL